MQDRAAAPRRGAALPFVAAVVLLLCAAPSGATPTGWVRVGTGTRGMRGPQLGPGDSYAAMLPPTITYGTTGVCLSKADGAQPPPAPSAGGQPPAGWDR
eukprot:gene40489-15649_t